MTTANIFNGIYQGFKNIFEGIGTLITIILPIAFLTCLFATIIFGAILLIYYIITKKSYFDLMDNEKRYRIIWYIVLIISTILAIALLSLEII